MGVILHLQEPTQEAALARLEQDLLEDPKFRALHERSRLKRAVGRMLHACRQAAGLTTRQLAERLGWRQPQVTRAESVGGPLPRLETLTALLQGSDGHLALVALDARGEFHVCSLTADQFAVWLAHCLKAERWQTGLEPYRPGNYPRTFPGVWSGLRSP
jgi:transcriptional regulator with XRE-family HTH domain